MPSFCGARISFIILPKHKSFLLPVQLSFKNNSNVYFSHPFLRYSQCTVQIPVSIHGLIGKYYCRTCGLTVSGCFACSNLAFTVISALNLPNKHLNRKKAMGEADLR